MKLLVTILSLFVGSTAAQASCYKIASAAEAMAETRYPVRDAFTAKMISYTEGNPNFVVKFEVVETFRGSLAANQQITVAINWTDINKYSQSKLNLLYTAPFRDSEFFAMSCTNTGSVTNPKTVDDLAWHKQQSRK